MGHPADNYDAYTEHHHEDHNAVLQKKQEQKVVLGCCVPTGARPHRR